ncbi:lmo0937 family membrane protein [Halobacillus sp. Marseille-P3879]|nr:lmo0937 family membrane protein [Halobacillus sp. Marseille-P3879]
MLWTIVIVILIIWLLGLVLDIAGGLINLLLIVAAIIIIMKVIRGRGKS